MKTTMVGTFGMHTIVFFRRHAETGEPLLDSPCVWTFDARDADMAGAEFERLKTLSHLFVPAEGYTLSCHKTDCSRGTF